MQETTTPLPPSTLPSGHTTWYMSIGFLIIVSLLSAICYGMAFFKEQNTNGLQVTIGELDKNIQEISTARNIVIAKIISENTLRPSIDLKNIVTQFRLAAIKADVAFDGFTIKDDTIRTSLTATQSNGQHPDPASTIINMMNEYAVGGQQFQLGNITSLGGDPTRRTTAIELKIMPTSSR